ncbi:MAG TPA: hypothetical protein DEA78_04210 [Cyanobacteria bacterium UBA11159]|nr:hypothetical protein [Cyanobacteria bacterium UBA11367]HBE60452.1 hypothetical protein [Cyanobacteria bacterium UBA11366]HBR72927.1 hypothetical protein [Cyanobacteria bacterium UBA11159]HBS70650.1 hypothetical protein [Cyanobacteria bacterium UBA11153]HCA93428.1 hypothetical protein [Cyanobacteria bacterium UBA9226]
MIDTANLPREIKALPNLAEKNSHPGFLIFGTAIGDALGFGTEWISKQQVTEKYPNGLHDYNQITRYQKSKGMEGWFPGDSTDDTDQMLCILDSLLEK